MLLSPSTTIESAITRLLQQLCYSSSLASDSQTSSVVSDYWPLRVKEFRSGTDGYGQGPFDSGTLSHPQIWGELFGPKLKDISVADCLLRVTYNGTKYLGFVDGHDQRNEWS